MKQMHYINVFTLKTVQTMDNKIIYFDNAATTAVNQDVLHSYNEVISSYIGNPGSIHFEGAKSFRLLEKARSQILDNLKMKDHRLIFTSGATEANNLALKGYALKFRNRGNHIIVSEIEHPSILETARQLEEFGFEVTYLKVDENGVVSLEELKKAIKNETILVSIMAVNNEIGSINPINEIALLLKKYPKIVFHCDAVQAIGKVDIDYSNVDMLTFTGHKIHGLKSGGALIVRNKIELLPLLTGGGQEGNIRSGTNDVAMAVSLAKALRIALTNQKNNKAKVNELSSMLYKYLKDNSDRYEINSYEGNPFVINFSTKVHKASVIVEGLSNKGIMVSSTSACHARGETGSYVVKALGKDEKISHNTIRVSLDEANTLDEMNKFIESLEEIERNIKQ